MKKKIIIAIDGTAGSGKSTLGKRLASRLNVDYVDSGAMYRAVGFSALKQNVPFEDEAGLVAMVKDLVIEQERESGELKIIVDGENVSSLIRTPEVSYAASRVAAIHGVREAINQYLRKMAAAGVVMEGRDIGSVVLPDADYKFFLDASIEVRAKRRHRDIKGAGINQNMDQVKDDIENRDRADQRREEAPMKPADDAEVIDTSDYTLEEMEKLLLNKIRSNS